MVGTVTSNELLLGSLVNVGEYGVADPLEDLVMKALLNTTFFGPYFLMNPAGYLLSSSSIQMNICVALLRCSVASGVTW